LRTIKNRYYQEANFKEEGSNPEKEKKNVVTTVKFHLLIGGVVVW